MGIRGLLKKLDSKTTDSPSPGQSNPYAQEQQPTGPPPEYREYSDHDPRARDQYNQQPPQKSYGGLPSDPRSGMRPGGGVPGFPARSTSNGPPPSQYPSPDARPSQYGASGYSPNSAGSTPVLPSTTSSAALGSVYPKEKYGAQDGVGGMRYGAPDPSPYGNSAQLPSQRQGAYGNLDAQGGGSYAGYNRPFQPGVRPGLPQLGASPSFSDAQQPTAEEENADAEVEAIKAKTEYHRDEALASGLRSLAALHDFNVGVDQANDTLDSQNETVAKTIDNMHKTNEEAQVGRINLTELDAAANASMLNFAANSKSRIAKHQEAKQNVRQLWEAKRRGQDNQDLDQQWEADQQRPAVTATVSKGLLGTTSAGAKSDRFGFETTFEDHDGSQAAKDAKHEEILDQLGAGLAIARRGVDQIGLKLDRSNKQLSTLGELVDTAGDTIGKNNRYLETKFKKR